MTFIALRGCEMFEFEVILFNKDREKVKITVRANSNRQAMLQGEQDYSCAGWRAELAKRNYEDAQTNS